MKARVGFGLAAAAVLIASSLAHAFLGWPALRSGLTGAATEEELIGALGVGWTFGSVAMLAFGLIVFAAAVEMLRGGDPGRATTGIIAAAYLIFGLAAFVIRDLNAHFLLFVVTGGLVGLFAGWPGRASE